MSERSDNGRGKRPATELLGAICGSAQSVDRAAQSMDPYFAQESVDRAGRSMNFAYDTIQLAQTYTCT